MFKQLKLFDVQEVHSYQCSDYVVLDSNRNTYNLLMNCDFWGCFVLYGVTGSGKTHLAHMWQKLRKAHFLTYDTVESTMVAIKGSNAVVVENIEHIADEAWLLHCYNCAKENGKPLLMTASVSPRQLNFKLKDLESRILSTMSAELANPNEELLRIMLVKLFTDRQMHTDAKTINYILNNVERSFKKLSDIVNLIDDELAFTSGGVTIPFVKSIIRRADFVQREGA
ncbi:DnaA ATPase domain-containing protein [Candidatus Anaplasma sp. TIGMIC]|uniref:DnaA ATPase domain-containing protein n=1 Tax=Candidatus Anaplasma sp. TIGMIC TaxID=3020713 RepID=UPI00232DA7FE|nr:DnaA/Hda family protein [Candidatus Anaplasma sp. TIGMIC]MDB1135032.1 DnaA/Hda family protein [Candidatus Anaplasma sp. TIGMIC]